MTTFLGVRPSDVCDWDTKPSATDLEVMDRSESDRRVHQGVLAA